MPRASPLPLSLRFALWFSAWRSGVASLDDARDGIVADDAAHDVVDLPSSSGTVPLIVALGTLRSNGATDAGTALPVPGDLLGLAGPPGFNSDALDVGEAVVLEGCGLGLVPHRAGAGVVWRCHRATLPRQVPDSSEADAALRGALVRTADALSDLEVARWRPAVADELMALRRPADFVFPQGTPARAVRVAALALRCRTVVDLALEDDGGSITAAEADARRRALAPLDAAARRALVAVCAPEGWD